MGVPEEDLASALDRIVQAGLLFRQGVAPHSSYLFKHALVQDALRRPGGDRCGLQQDRVPVWRVSHIIRECAGTGLVQSQKCHGQRTAFCLACRGSGEKSIAGVPIGNCKECGGTGQRRCDICGGTGEVDH